MADPTDAVELALDELQHEPLPTHTREQQARPPEDEIEVEYAEEGQPRQQEAPPASQNRDTSTSDREIPAAEGIAELRTRLEGAEVARRQAEERASLAERARAEAYGQTQDANVQFLETALGGVKQSMGVLEANLAEAYAVQDFAGAAKIQTEIARTAQRESAIETGLEQLKTMPREQPRAAAPPPQQGPADQVEQVARQLTPNAAAWIRAHPDYVTDPNKNQRLMSAHYAAMADGLSPDSPDYIRYVEGKVLGGQSQPVERREPVAETTRRSAAPPPAPVSRGNGAAASPTRVTLTPDQRQTAHENFPDEMREDPTGRKAEQAYARNMLILQREKRIN
ncbi:MAG TPA: hypothetical protein VGF50_14240 [Caulobacteraceae bacterium]|jgi:hypothetical protein